MVTLALDTTTRAGSLALAKDAASVATFVGDAERKHSERLPGDIQKLLDQAGFRSADIDRYAVCSGPASFTGLRVGIATIQGLALAHGRLVLPVSTLEALAWNALWSHTRSDTRSEPFAPGDLVVAWLDAARREVFACVYAVPARPWEPELLTPGKLPRLEQREAPSVGHPSDLVAQWAPGFQDKKIWIVGEGVDTATLGQMHSHGARVHRIAAGPLAAVLARLAWLRVDEAVRPHAVRPVYVRRPDAELARERRQK
jgi:tRNA threonylcarbamoyladenosine biosynthesis protein TsaB